MGYGTGAIMAVPGHDERDFEFAETFNLPIVAVVMPPESGSSCIADRHRFRATSSRLREYFKRHPGRLHRGLLRRGTSIQSENPEFSINGQPTAEAKRPITAWLAEQGLGRRAVNYKLRDWLFSRQRYWGEPFPIVLDEQRQGAARRRIRAAVLLARARRLQADRQARAAAEQGHGLGPVLRALLAARPTPCPSGPGSCWYYLRYLDPRNAEGPGTRRRRSTGCRSTSTSAAPSTRSCTCSTAGSGTRCSSTAGWSARPSRSSGWSTRG